MLIEIFDLLTFLIFQIAVKCGIYHGAEALCDIMTTSKQTGSNPKWNEFVEFKLPVCDIPRMARMCFCIYGYAMNKVHLLLLLFGFI